MRASPIAHEGDSVEQKRQTYLQSIVVLNVMTALFLVVAVVGIMVLFVFSNKNQQILLDCTDRRRTDSDCQKYQNERTSNLVNGPFAQIVSAYTLCADSKDGDEAIKMCVSNKLRGK